MALCCPPLPVHILFLVLPCLAPAAGRENSFPFISSDLMAAGMLANNPDMVSGQGMQLRQVRIGGPSRLCRVG